MGWNIISTGGTYKFLQDKGIKVTDVQELTDFPEILDGRVKTLSPRVFGGLLYRRNDPKHVSTIEEHKLTPIDMVVNILYPFQETLANPNSTPEEIIEKIDIGGPSMVRAAAKNFNDVIIVTSTKQYDRVIEKLKNDSLDLEERRKLAGEAFEETAKYDCAIMSYFNDEKMAIHLDKVRDLRYGENPHQNASFYAYDKNKDISSYLLQGKELSFNNMLDITAALQFIENFEEPTAIGIKHTNPCAIASDEDIEVAYDKCIKGDSESIFGGIIILNRPITKSLAEKMTSFFLEIVIAPEVEEDAKEVFKSKKNLRVLETGKFEYEREKDYRFVAGGVLVQDLDKDLYKELSLVTDKKASEKELEDLIFAFKACKCVKSNGIAIVKDKMTIGLGIGDVNRFFASSHALDMAGKEAAGAVVASDGFFPFPDSIKAYHEAGIVAVIQPGGSIKDKETIDYANENGLAMYLTSMRHFRH